MRRRSWRRPRSPAGRSSSTTASTRPRAICGGGSTTSRRRSTRTTCSPRAAIPTVFPAVHVDAPRAARGWYFDGGTRLNTPVKPALAFGAARVVVLALDSLAPARPARRRGAAGRPRRGCQILQGLLADQLTSDLQTLATINTLTRATRIVPGRKRRVPYIVIAPSAPDAIGRCALEVLRRYYRPPLGPIRSPDIALLGRLIAGGSDVQHAELLSFLLFSPQFARALIELGRRTRGAGSSSRTTSTSCGG